MTYFGMDDIPEEPKEHCLPEGLKEAGVTEKRQWFHQQLYSMLDTHHGQCRKPKGPWSGGRRGSKMP